MDFSYLLLLQHIREACGGVFDSLMLNITSLATGIITYLLLGAVYWCVDKRAGQLMALNVSVACTLNQFVKNIFRIERPWIRDSRITPVQEAISGAGGYSFPSGHTTRATAVWGALGESLRKQKQKALFIACYLVVLGVGFSRNYLGVHTAKDVLAALAAGVVLILLLDKVMSWADKKESRDIAVAVIGCLICFVPMLKVGCLTNAGAGMGFWIGWVLERHFVQFETEDTWARRCVRFAVGGAGIVFILTTLQGILGQVMEGKYAGFFTSFSVAVFIMAVYPFFFCKKERYKAGIGILAAVLAGLLVFAFGWQQHLQRNADAETEIENAADTVDNVEGAEAGQAEPETAHAVNLPLIIAHRGYSSVFPENTLVSFTGALDIGVDFIELDVQLSKDGQVVILHDDSLKRTTGVDGAASDFTGEELAGMDAGSWFNASFAGEKIPTLEEALNLVKGTECKVYLELKDIGDVEGLVETVVEVTEGCGMAGQCVFASFRYDYLAQIKALNESYATLYNTNSGKTSLPEEFPADYYGLNLDTIRQETVKAIHEAGKQAFVWTVNTPAQMKNVQTMGIDGIVTNYPGLAKVILHPEYEYLAENYEGSLTMPGLYEPELPEKFDDMIVQGFTKAGNVLAVSAYSKSGEYDSILYIMDLNGRLLKTVDLKFKAHTGGIAYDEEHDLLWVTGPSGLVYAITWSSVMADTYNGEIQVEFDAGLLNHGGSKVASFLTLFEGQLFVGSYFDGENGTLNRYSLSDVENPRLISAVTIPQRIQGITFKREAATGVCYMYLSQGYQTDDACLLKFLYDEQAENYADPLESHVLPEGVEQIQMTGRGMYLLFESAVRPYRPTARIPNDQIYLVRE